AFPAALVVVPRPGGASSVVVTASVPVRFTPPPMVGHAIAPGDAWTPKLRWQPVVLPVRRRPVVMSWLRPWRWRPRPVAGPCRPPRGAVWLGRLRHGGRGRSGGARRYPPQVRSQHHELVGDTAKRPRLRVFGWHRRPRFVIDGSDSY